MSIDLEAIKARADAATEGPWEPVVLGSDGYMVAQVGDEDPTIRNPRRRVAFCTSAAFEVCRADAEFIAHAREDVPELVAEVERLEPLADAARLLGPARSVLDRAALGDTRECAVMAQRIVDLIGHPVTDEPPHTVAEVVRLRFERDQARDIVVALEQENARLAGQRDAVLMLHSRSYQAFISKTLMCLACATATPCPTARALGVES